MNPLPLHILAHNAVANVVQMYQAMLNDSETQIAALKARVAELEKSLEASRISASEKE
jgi:uncharacterized protein YceH (UPF0502 family)